MGFLRRIARNPFRTIAMTAIGAAIAGPIGAYAGLYLASEQSKGERESERQKAEQEDIENVITGQRQAATAAAADTSKLSAEAAKEEEVRKRRIAQFGTANLPIFTSPLGLGSGAPISRKRLLGE